MTLSWNEIKSRALAFAKHWADAGNEDAQAKPFLIAFFEVFGITDKRFASFEHAVKKNGGGQGFVDAFWPGILLIEMKSRGKNLDRAYTQAIDYFPGLKERDLPRYVLVCDFAHFRVYDLIEGITSEFALAEFHKNVRLFGFIAGYQTQVIKPQDPINIHAAEHMGRLHDQMKAVGYVGRPLEFYLVRLLFCLFAEDTGICEKRQFQDYIEQRAAHVDGQQMLDIHQLVAVDVDQFYGIETEEFPAQIAQVALWLVDHQMNIKVSEEFGAYFVRIPLKHAATIVHGNALRIDWNDVLPAERCAYVLGNPPFVGKSYQNSKQKADMAVVVNDVSGAGVLDFVAAWYVKAARYMAVHPAIRAAFVSTNSITQGEQVGVLWGWLLAHGVKIRFAHRTFSWSNEARGNAAVHCVIVGFGLQEVAEKTIFEYDDVRGEAHAV